MDYKHLLTKLSRGATLAWMLLAASVLFIVALLMWWQFVYTSPERVFREMLARNFMTHSYTRTTDIADESFNQQRVTSVQLGVDPVVRIRALAEQGDARQESELLAYPDREYVQFLQYPNENIENIWAVSPMVENFDGEVVQRTYFPMGPIDGSEREKLLNDIERTTVYSANYQTVEKTKLNGKDVYVYEVSIQLQAYAAMLVKFAQQLGLEDSVSMINPADYAGEPPIVLKVSVDRASRQLVQVVSEGQEGYVESYSAYGAAIDITEPKEAISLDELQSLLES